MSFLSERTAELLRKNAKKTLSQLFKRAWQIRKQAAQIYGEKAIEYSMSICLEMARKGEVLKSHIKETTINEWLREEARVKKANSLEELMQVPTYCNEKRSIQELEILVNKTKTAIEKSHKLAENEVVNGYRYIRKARASHHTAQLSEDNRRILPYIEARKELEKGVTLAEIKAEIMRVEEKYKDALRKMFEKNKPENQILPQAQMKIKPSQILDQISLSLNL